MLFHSLEYLLFLPLVVILHYLLPHKWRWSMLLTASCLFYAAWRVEFLPLIIFSTLVDYLVGLRLYHEEREKTRKALLTVSVCINIGLLLSFKYLATGWLLVGDILIGMGVIDQITPLDIVLPLGISFYTFQTLSYTIDIYRRRIKPEPHLGYFATYVTFFPQLLAGPIERASQLLPRLRKERPFSTANITLGMGFILLGFSKKLVIADHLANLTAPVAAMPGYHSAIDVISTPPLIMYQYYCDLSGYADIALGSALLLGVRLAQNFARPFAATSITRFWFRWHITVTLWFRDYLLVPLAGSRPSLFRRTTVVLLTGILIGLWHGPTAGWLVAGLTAGTMAIAENRWRKWRINHLAPPRAGWPQFINNGLGRLYVWLMFSFVIGIPVAFGSLDGLSIAWQQIVSEVDLPSSIWSLRSSNLLIFCLAIPALELWQWLEERRIPYRYYKTVSGEWIWLGYGILAILIMMFGELDSQYFVYFRI